MVFIYEQLLLSSQIFETVLGRNSREREMQLSPVLLHGDAARQKYNSFPSHTSSGPSEEMRAWNQMKQGGKSSPESPERSRYTHKTGAQAEDGGEVAPAVDVSAEKAVAHVAPLRPVALLCSQVHHRVRGGEEVGVCCQIQMESFSERVDPVEKPQSGQVIV